MSNVYTKLRECYAKPVNKDTKCALSLPSDNKKGKTEKNMFAMVKEGTTLGLMDMSAKQLTRMVVK